MRTTTTTHAGDKSDASDEVQGYVYAPGTHSTTLPVNPFGPRPAGFPAGFPTRPA